MGSLFFTRLVNVHPEKATHEGSGMALPLRSQALTDERAHAFGADLALLLQLERAKGNLAMDCLASEHRWPVWHRAGVARSPFGRSMRGSGPFQGSAGLTGQSAAVCQQVLRRRFFPSLRNIRQFARSNFSTDWHVPGRPCCRFPASCVTNGWGAGSVIPSPFRLAGRHRRNSVQPVCRIVLIDAC